MNAKYFDALMLFLVFSAVAETPGQIGPGDMTNDFRKYHREMQILVLKNLPRVTVYEPHVYLAGEHFRSDLGSNQRAFTEKLGTLVQLELKRTRIELDFIPDARTQEEANEQARRLPPKGQPALNIDFRWDSIYLEKVVEISLYIMEPVKILRSGYSPRGLIKVYEIKLAVPVTAKTGALDLIEGLRTLISEFCLDWMKENPTKQTESVAIHLPCPSRT